jgi:hypothetical protein
MDVIVDRRDGDARLTFETAMAQAA